MRKELGADVDCGGSEIEGGGYIREGGRENDSVWLTRLGLVCFAAEERQSKRKEKKASVFGLWPMWVNLP